MYTRPLARLIEQLQRLPGVGPKTAQRLALYILQRPDIEIQALAQALLDAKEKVGQCSVCFHLTADPVCEICLDPTRDRHLICLVIDSRDVIALEKTREYRGLYHVLGGLISPMDGISPEQLNIQPLIQGENLPPLRCNRTNHSSNVKVAIGLRQWQDSKILNYLPKQQQQHGYGQK